MNSIFLSIMAMAWTGAVILASLAGSSSTVIFIISVIIAIYLSASSVVNILEKIHEDIKRG